MQKPEQTPSSVNIPLLHQGDMHEKPADMHITLPKPVT
jgi:hypothetical protein